MKRIDGKAISEKFNLQTKSRAGELKAQGIIPGLAVVLVGQDPASVFYVRQKDKVSQELGFYSRKIELPAETTQEELLRIVDELNHDPQIHGILVQSPPPKHINEAAIVLALDPRKDVDGFHPINVAKLAMDDPTGFVPCTPLGCIKLLEESGIETSGKHAVVLGRSMIVGKPMALLLMRKGQGGDATVTVCHSRTQDIAAVTSQGDILIAAIGRAEYVKPNFVKEGAVVIDVGINRVEDTSAAKGYRVAGDVEFATVAPKCSAITPVPGGVGPMTIAMLMHNTLLACERLNGLS